ncbi:MAG TPA: ATP-binding cassette domain-containing protein [Devosia sp.]|nr:ATP-binding cassette domain-containing protein [Devosia sp.]
MSGIEIKDASVSYFLRHKGEKKRSLERGAVGGQIIQRQRYLEIAALKNISLSFKHGDRVGLVGLNGSGKSTLLKLCSGALSIQSGSIEIDGRVSAQFSLGAGIKASLSGRRNAELKCLYMGTPQRSIAERVEDVKALSGLGGYFELPVSTYSAGMRSRLVMSMIRLVKADILIMDEWIGTADGAVNKAIGQIQSELIESSSLLVLASHSDKVLRQWVSKIVWLDAGVVKAVGPTDEVLAEYQKLVAQQR